MNKKKTSNPEGVVKRKSYYGFSKRFPGNIDGGTYLIGDSRSIKRKETVKKIIAAVVYLLLFAAAYVVTSAALYISEGAI